MRPQVFDKEKIHWNTAWTKKHGNHFEVVVNPDEALAFKQSKGASPDIRECVRSEHVFSEAKAGTIAADENLEEAFGTTDPLEIAKVLILEGELQLSAEHRAAIREAMLNKLITRIHAYAVDPKTGNPHPRTRIELAMDEAKVRIDYNKDVESQVQDVIRMLQPILPIKLETVTLQVHLPHPYGQKLYGELQRYGAIKKTDWLNDGSLAAWVELPAGLQADLIEELGKESHGAADIKKVDGRAV